ncbi:hypothetical protein BOQ60_26540, partial [Chryseobacterium sp. CH1]
IKFDESTGWITNQNITVKTTQIETISDGKQSQSMKSVSNSSVMVNPLSLTKAQDGLPTRILP